MGDPAFCFSLWVAQKEVKEARQRGLREETDRVVDGMDLEGLTFEWVGPPGTLN